MDLPERCSPGRLPVLRQTGTLRAGGQTGAQDGYGFISPRFGGGSEVNSTISCLREQSGAKGGGIRGSCARLTTTGIEPALVSA